MLMTALSLACVAPPRGPWMSVPALTEPSILNLKASVSKGIGSLSWILVDLVSDGTTGRSDMVWVPTSAVSGDPSNPSDPSPSAGGLGASVVAVAAGLRCPSDATVASSERNFTTLSLPVGCCNISIKSWMIFSVDGVAVAVAVAVAGVAFAVDAGVAFAAFFAVNPGGSFLLLLVVVDAKAFFLAVAVAVDVADDDDAAVASLFVLFLDPLRLHDIDFVLVMLLLLLLAIELPRRDHFVGH